MTRPTALLALAACLMCSAALAGETITAQEVESYFYSDGEMKHSPKGAFEITYYLDENTVTRTRVYDINEKKVMPDNTIYKIERQLMSDPSRGGYAFPGKSVIRAIGSPGLDALEILMIGETFIESVRSTSDYFVISRLKRIK
jgi:hypothetical protein